MRKNGIDNYITVVISAHNAEGTIAGAIESVLAQSFADFELILVNAGSTDGTQSIICSYNDKRIRFIDSSQDRVQSLNAGMKASAGRYIALMDADSTMHVDRLKVQYSVMEDYPDVAVCSSGEIVFGETLPKRTTEQKASGFVECPLVQLLLDDIGMSRSYTIRKSFVEKHNVLFENCDNAEDYKFRAETAKFNGGFYVDSQPLVYRKISDTDISGNRRLKMLKSISKIKKEILDFICKKHNDTHPALTDLYNSCYKLLEQNMISEDEIFNLFYSLLIKNAGLLCSVRNDVKGVSKLM